MSQPTKLPRGPLLVILLLSLGGAADHIVTRHDFWSLHVMFELFLMVIGLGSVAYYSFKWRSSDARLKLTEAQLRRNREERDEWRRRAETSLRGLSAEIDRQFRAWSLTPVESDTALLLLKGLGTKEIAALQEKSERTVRQHAVTVYRKSGLSGRAELSAFFLEDLMLPATDPSLRLASTVNSTT